MRPSSERARNRIVGSILPVLCLVTISRAAERAVPGIPPRGEHLRVIIDTDRDATFELLFRKIARSYPRE